VAACVPAEELIIKNANDHPAQLKDLMTTPPMSARQHAEVMRKRSQIRRELEEAKERKELADAEIFGGGQ
jgi:hypothetical protein